MPIGIAGSGAITGTTTINGLTMPSDAIAPGLVLINKTDFTTVSTVSINNCFTSTYDNYKIIINFTAFSANGDFIYARLRVSGSDATTNYNCVRVYGNGTSVGTDNPGSTAFPVGYNYSGYPTALVTTFDLMRPNVVELTKINGSKYYYNAGSMYSITYGGMHNSSTAYDSLSILTASGGTMSGTIRIYGYRN